MLKKSNLNKSVPTIEKKNRGGGGGKEKKIVIIDPVTGEEQNTKL